MGALSSSLNTREWRKFWITKTPRWNRAEAPGQRSRDQQEPSSSLASLSSASSASSLASSSSSHHHYHHYIIIIIITTSASSSSPHHHQLHHHHPHQLTSIKLVDSAVTNSVLACWMVNQCWDAAGPSQQPLRPEDLHQEGPGGSVDGPSSTDAPPALSADLLFEFFAFKLLISHSFVHHLLSVDRTTRM